MSINKTPVSRDQLGTRLKEIYDPRPSKVLFIKADGSNKYQEVIWAMDVARGSGVKVIGVPPKDAGK
jgi:biopolymer transport protein ExbD